MALFNKESNGLIQTEVSTKIIFNAIPIKRNFYFLNFIEPSFKYSKFDNKYSSIEVTDSVKPYSVDKVLLNQLSYIQIGVKLSLFRVFHFNNALDILTFGLRYNLSNINIISYNKTEMLSMFSLSLGTDGSILKYRNFGLTYSVNCLLQRVLNSDISGYESYSINWDSNFELFYHPLEKPENKIFLRFNVFYSPWDNLHMPGNISFYPLLQLGYASKLKYK